MIYGIGTDIVRIPRIEQVLVRHGDKFAERILRPAEYGLFLETVGQSSYLAKRFAAKEAVSKALGTGIGFISWQDIEVLKEESGAPALALFGNALQRLTSLGASRAMLSLSDEVDYALAFVVLC